MFRVTFTLNEMLIFQRFFNIIFEIKFFKSKERILEIMNLKFKKMKVETL